MNEKTESLFSMYVMAKQLEVIINAYEQKYGITEFSATTWHEIKDVRASLETEIEMQYKKEQINEDK